MRAEFWMFTVLEGIAEWSLLRSLPSLMDDHQSLSMHSKTAVLVDARSFCEDAFQNRRPGRYHGGLFGEYSWCIAISDSKLGEPQTPNHELVSRRIRGAEDGAI